MSRILSEKEYFFGRGAAWWRKSGMKKRTAQSRNIGDVPVGVAWQVLFLKNKETAF